MSIISVLFVAVSGWELSFLVFGKVASGTVSSHKTEVRSKKNGSYRVVAVTYSFQTSDGEYRSGWDDMPEGWNPPPDKAVPVEYLPWIRLASRLQDASPSHWVTMIVYGSFMVTFGSFLVWHFRRRWFPAIANG